MATYRLERPRYLHVVANRAKTPSLTILGILVGAFIAVLFVHCLMVPYLGVDISLVNGEWRVNQADPNGTAFRDGIRSQDRVIMVNGITPYQLAGGFDYIGAHQASSLEVVNSSGQVKSSSAATGPVPAGAVLESIGYFTVSAAFWLVGFLSFIRKPGSRQVLFLFAMSLFVALTSAASLDSERGWEVTRHLEVFASVPGPWLVASFFLEFPFRKRIKLFGTDITALIYLPPTMMLLAYILVAHENSAFYSWFRPVAAVNLAAGFLTAIIIVAHSYMMSSFARFRQQIKVVALGAAISMIPMVVFTIVPVALGGDSLLPSQITIMGFVALPLALAHATSSQKLLDTDLAIGQATRYAIFSCALVAFYVFAIWLGGTLFPGIDLRWQVVLLLSFTMVALALSAPARGRLQKALDARISRGRYDYRRAASDIIADLASRTDLEDVAQLLATDISRFLRLEGACVLLNLEGKGLTCSAAYGTYADHPIQQGHLLRFCQDLSEGDRFPNPAPPESGASLLVSLSRGNKQIGILALTNKASDAAFSVDDIYFLFNIQNQGSLAIDNALLLKEAKLHAQDLESAVERLEEYNKYLERSRSALEQAYINIIRTLVLAVESRSPYTKGHSDRVTQLARRIGVQMGLGPSELHDLQLAGRIHDIGKMGIPDSILLKSGPLEHHERAEIELHPLKGVEIVRFLDFLRGAIPMIESHHEWYDGGGYPRGLHEDEIPLGARIIAVADAFDAMTSDRPYRKACTSLEAIKRLSEGAGMQWDPKVVEALMNLPGLGNEDA